jgi:N-acetylglucosaminyldiphosphoundecaprenol N-acetyl-beta-D-mannosaminyltransferase
MFTLLTVNFFCLSTDDLLKRIQQSILKNERFYVCVTGVHGLMLAQQMDGFTQILNGAKFNVPDGMPIVWMGKLLHKNGIERIYGPNLTLSLCALAERNGWKIYLYGTTSKTLHLLKEKLLKEFPGLSIVGTYAPPYRVLNNKEKNDTYTHINRTRPHIVFVGISTPKQEMWVGEARKHLQANMLIGSGAAFDFISGVKKQAPVWIQRAGFEWLYRLVQEPRRLSRRYIMMGVLLVIVGLRYLYKRLVKFSLVIFGK